MASEQSKNIPDWSARQVIVGTVFVVLVGLGFWLVYRYRVIILLLFAAIVVGTALRPLVNWLVKRGLSRGISIAVVFVILLIILAGLIWIAAPLVVVQTVELVRSLPEMYIDARSLLLTSSSVFLQNIGLNLPPDLERIWNTPSPENESMDSVTRFMTVSGSILYVIVALLAVFFLTIYWILESERTKRGLLIVVPTRIRQSGRELFDAIETRVGAYLRGQLILSIAIGLTALAAYLIIGLPNALALALFAGIFEAVPIFGPALGAIPAALVAISIDPTLLIWVVVSTVIIQTLENYLLVPRIMDASVGVHPIIVLLSLVTFTSLFGFAGALLAIPLASVVQLLVDRFVFSPDRVYIPESAGRGKESALHYEIHDLISDIRKQVRKKDEPSDESSDQIEDAIESLAVELDTLLAQNDHE